MPGYVTILRRHLALVLLLALTGLLAGGAAVLLRGPRYQAVADVQLQQVESPFRGPGGTRGDLTRAIQTQIDVATGEAVQARVQSELGSVPPIEVMVKGERDELEFRAVADTGPKAARIANAWADGYVAVLRADADAEAERYLASFDAVYSRVYEQIDVLDAEAATATPAQRSQLELQREVLVTQLKALAGRRTPEGSASAAQILASPVRSAQVPENPMSDTAKRLLALGLVAGLVLGYLLACLKESVRDHVRDAEDVGVVAPGTAVLGPVAVPTGSALAVLDDPDGAAALQLLRAEVTALGATAAGQAATGPGTVAAGEAQSASVLAVTSASEEAPVGPIAAGLALSLARAGRRVVLLDAELQHPRQHDLFATLREPGLSNVIDHELPVDAALVPVAIETGATLWLLPAGAGGRDDLLAVPSFAALVHALRTDPAFDTVVIAAPALLGTAGSLAVAEIASSVLVVAAPHRTRRRHLAAALRRLALAAPPVSAVVLATTTTQAASPGRPTRRGWFGKRSQPDPQVVASARPAQPSPREARSSAAGQPVDSAGRQR